MANEKSKKYFWILLDVLLAGFILSLFFFLMPMLDDIGNSKYPSRTVTVAAEGKVTVKPDLAQFSFSIVTEGADLARIAEENNNKIAEVIDYIKSEGVDGDNIKTTQYNLAPRYEYDKNRRISFISGYELIQSVFVKIHDLEENIGKISEILGSLPEMGVNRLSGVSFTVEDPEEHLAKARSEAFKKAREKAKTMAESVGVSLGKVVNFSEHQNGPIYPYYDKAMGIERAMESSIPLAVPTPIEPGTEEITISVYVTYEIR